MMEPDLPQFERGWVWLVGAGPGDPGLLTLNALHALRHADSVVYDALVDRRILALAPPGAKLVFAGKRGGQPSPSQPDISQQLVRLARQGHRVVRLKGGDPFVFGRGAEEALALVEAGIPFRLVPGVSAGIGGLAYAGIPLTHRETNSAVTFLTGHLAGRGAPDSLDWGAIARGAPVLVVFMALTTLGEVAARLIENGRRADEPAAIVTKASTPEQRVVTTTLAAAARAAGEAGLEPPAMLVVGEVVRLRAKLAWYGADRADAPPAQSPIGAR